ncbi:hypothetical protein [Streptomyces sp. ME19-01-6]|uniref:hypothetical protein n=1 Tax=Streptomyces sp. ME19-01-6 TaxID=3028686 RepID=UPI0029B333E5|nr:hypothetical protein [Streptomyces sp. ME19-01-6]MDX3224163.1 hypothetical protein [Streptomyces sp. ME19-01-6]
MNGKIVKRGLAVVAAGATAVIISSGPANAVTYKYGECSRTPSGWCDTWLTLTLYYNSDFGGAASSFGGKINNYTTDSVVYVFGGTVSGTGYGNAVKNNAASGCVDSNNENYKVFYNSYQKGVSQTFTHGTCKNLNSDLKNQNASQDWYS